jgi:non-histone protein 10
LRTKRGHRKPDFLTTDVGDGRPGSAFIQQGPVTLSPSSDAFSHTHPDPLRNSTPQANSNSHNKKHLPSNGTHGPSHPAPGTSKSSRPRSAFDVYCDEHRPILLAERKDLKDDGEIETILAKGWTTLNTEKRAEYSAKFDQIRKAVEADREPISGAREAGNDAEQSRGEVDEDVEMGDDVGTPIPAAGGFTAVNN